MWWWCCRNYCNGMEKSPIAAGECVRQNCPSQSQDVEFVMSKENKLIGMIYTCQLCGAEWMTPLSTNSDRR